jgi:hypothetical protein
LKRETNDSKSLGEEEEAEEEEEGSKHWTVLVMGSYFASR